jgi:hypothetical protein
MGMNVIGFGPKTTAFPSIPVPLVAGGAYVIPSGQYQVVPGPLTFFQWYDPVTQIWRPYQTPTQSDSYTITSDGSNYRLANLTGGVVGAVITNAGTGYTNGIYPPSAQLGTAAAPSITVAAGASSVLAKGTLIVGGALPTAAGNYTITGGSNYTYAPTVTISAPPAGGVPATATCTISGGAVNAITITNQGAGYTAAPTITLTTHPLDTTGAGASIVASTAFALAGSGTVTAITFPINGVGYTAVPALSFSPASTTAATAIMCFTCTAVTWTGATNAGNGNFGLIGSTVTAGTATLTNPAISTGIFTPRYGQTAFSTTASPTTTVIVDGGLHQTVPNAVLVLNSNGTISGATTTTITQGGAADLSYLIPL